MQATGDSKQKGNSKENENKGTKYEKLKRPVVIQINKTCSARTSNDGK